MQNQTFQLLQAAFRHQQAGNLAEAEAGYRQVLARNPRNPNALCGLGTIARAAGHFDAAIDLIRRAIAVAPDAPALHRELAITFRLMDRIEQAAESWRRVSQLEPNSALGHAEMGMLLMLLKRLPEAAEALQRAVSLDPTSAVLQTGLGSVLARSGRYEEALAALRRAVELDPESADAHQNLALGFRHVGRMDESEEQFRQAIRCKPDHPIAGSGLLLTLQYRRHDRSAVFAEHRDWEKRVASSMRRTESHANDPMPERRLRIGYVSGDFRLHSVAFFIEPLLAAHDSAVVEVFCYDTARRPDAVTARMKNHAHAWREGASQDQLIQRICDDRIDIVIDLAGHTAGDRLLAFAARPAPVQITYLGYPDTTGLSAIDYRITDSWADPPGDADRIHTEQLIRLPRCAWCYRPPDDAPQSQPRRRMDNEPIVFGSFNGMPKFSPEIVRIWAQILARVPSSRLFLKTKPLRDSLVRQHLIGLFADHGIDSSRLELQGHMDSLADHLSSYDRMDIALDSYPYHGTTTTCDALWMGVPVITLAGDRHVSRVGVSLLNAIGHPELIANSADEYVEIAVNLAHERDRLGNLHENLRQEMLRSPITDAASLARAFEIAYRAIWRNWCRQRH